MKLTRRCRAVLEPQQRQPYHGRCDLRVGHEGPHLLERGMDEIRWSTEPIRTPLERVEGPPQ